MKKITFYYIFLCILLPSLSFGEETQQSKNKLILEILEKSGAKQQIEAIPMVVQSLIQIQLAAQGMNNNQELSLAIQKSFEKFFLAENMIKAITKHFEANFNRTHLEKYLEWLNTDFGRKITDLEIKGSSPEAVFAIMAYSFQIQANPPEEKRMKLSQELIKILDVEKQGAKKSEAIFIKMIEGMNKNLSEEQKLSGDIIENIKLTVKKSAEDQMNMLLIPTILYIYQSLSDDEFEKYTDFLKTEAGQWFNKHLLDATLFAIEQDSEKIGQEMGKRIAEIGMPDKKEFK